MRLATIKETPLVTVLLTSGGKSLVFIVLALLARSRVTIIVAPYTELKK
jgi:superfamily II DNA helicase RecQ